MALTDHKRAVGVFSSRHDAESALHDLRDAGFPMDRVSIVARHSENDDIAGVDVQDVNDTKAGDHAKKGAAAGGALGGITGLLVGLGAVAIPGIGPVMLSGAAATAIATALSGGAIGAAAGGLIGALTGLGIPEDRARHYSDRVSHGDYLVMVEGSDTEIRHAQTVLNHRGIKDWGVFDIPNTTHSTSTQTTTPHVASSATTTTTTRQDIVEVIDNRNL